MYRKSWQRQDADWHFATPLIKNRSPVSLRPWLFDIGSLTQQLRAHCRDEGFAVRLLRQDWRFPLPSEARVLGISEGQRAFIRQVHLFCGEHPAVYARTVIPHSVAMGRLRGLTHLGTRPLGEVLFANRTMHRGAIEIARIPPQIALNRLAWGEQDAAGTIWGRRSVFHLYNLPLLVSEIFLSDFST